MSWTHGHMIHLAFMNETDCMGNLVIKNMLIIQFPHITSQSIEDKYNNTLRSRVTIVNKTSLCVIHPPSRNNKAHTF